MRISITCVLMLICLLSSGQEYHAFPTNNAIWTEMYYNPYPEQYAEFHAFKVDGDTILQNIQYHKLFFSTDTIFNESKIFGGIREEDKKVFCYLTNPLPERFIWMSWAPDSEILLYDFNLKLGDTIRYPMFRIIPRKLIVTEIDSILIGDTYRRILTFGPSVGSSIPWAQWVEGIGNLRGLLFRTGDVPTNGLFNDIICHSQNGELLYHNYSKYQYCFYENPSSVEGHSSGNGLKIYPNPTKQTALIEFGYNKIQSIHIIDLTGNIVRTFQTNNLRSISINKEGMQNGMYLVIGRNEYGSFCTSKLVFE